MPVSPVEEAAAPEVPGAAEEGEEPGVEEEELPAVLEDLAGPVEFHPEDEEDHEMDQDPAGRVLKPLPSPNMPTAAELEEHNLTHCPSRTWCPHCMRGRGVSRAHRKLMAASERRVPQVVIDYAFMGQEGDESTMPILVVKDCRTRRIFCHSVPCKGIAHEYPVRQLVNDLYLLGYKRLILKSDGEPAILALKAEVKEKIKIDVLCEEPSVGESQSNGEIENANRLMQGQVRTMFDALKTRYGFDIDTKHPALKWLIQHAGAIITRFMTGVDGKTAWERERGKKYRRQLPEFGECVHYMPIRRSGSKLMKLAPRLQNGIFLGIRESNDELFIGTEKGVVRASTVHRKPLPNRWDVGEFGQMVGVPWKPIPSIPDATEAAIAIPESGQGPAPPPVVAAPREYVPRVVYLRQADFAKHGFTPGCRGCESIITKATYRVNHNVECRQRMVAVMKEDEEGKVRVAEAEMREDQFLADAVEKSDKKRKMGENRDAGPELIPDAQMEAEPVHGGSSLSAGPMVIEPPQGVKRAMPETPPMEISGVETWVEEFRQLNELEEKYALLLQLGSVGVAEVYSPPRVTAKASSFGIRPGFALDLTVLDEDGEAWDFSIPAKREKARKLVVETQPFLLVGSPPCTPFSRLQALNYPHMDQAKVQEMMRAGIMHLEFCIELYWIQLEAGRFFLHEHPDSASSWQVKAMQKLLEDERVLHVKGDMCAQGMTSNDWDGVGLVKKTTGWATNSPRIAEQVSARCSNKDGEPSEFVQFDSRTENLGLPRKAPFQWNQVTRRLAVDAESGFVLQDLRDPQQASKEKLFEAVPRWVKVVQTTFYYRRGGTPWHRHVHLVGGRAKAAQVYPDPLVVSILRGLKQEMNQLGMLNSLEAGPTNEEPEVDYEGLYPEVFDQVSGQKLDPEMVKAARATEMTHVRRYGVYEKVPLRVCMERTGKKPIRVKWVDINKGDDTRPDYRARLVAMEIRKSWQAAAFAGTPPLESLRFLLSLCKTRSPDNTVSDPLKLSFIDIRRAHFTAKATRELYVELPEEDQEAGEPMCGRLLKSMYGTQDAAQNWENEYGDFMVSNGFEKGLGSPCLFFHPVRNLRVSVHGDDFTSLGSHANLLWLKDRFLERYEIKDSGIMGPGEDDIKEVRVLNRLISWREDCIEYEADPRHVQIIAETMGIGNAKPVTTPGVREPDSADEKELIGSQAFTYRSVTMRAQYLAQDRPEIQFAFKELARGMQKPTNKHWAALKRLARFLQGKPRLIWRFSEQDAVSCLWQYTDSDDAGCPTTRKSTSSGHLMHGKHLLKAYSSTQQQLALSSGESEFYGTIKAASTALGARAMAADLGVELGATLATDASASKAMVSRIGFGKAKHISRCFLWIQQRIRERELKVAKVGTDDNPADLGTKHLDVNKMNHLLKILNLFWSDEVHSLGLKAAV